ncbi:unnamed protein product [Rotaria sp. Silwood2]|nr:unnamed protein product [Rotaria sp. Silwood2]CAF3062599.1 unnamed protein product [Rotaria sp. Silwood2]CAF3321761.1 unnamed protein product [Rotaria sp. Silwood2]CAF4304660.1 unnamed protein product [Rotaria sp. Silwood2]CAF4383762.1 unnamed protein product [Rotaria sp. Silwood2]
MNNNDIVLQITSATFDIHIQEILGSMVLSSTLVMLHPNGNLEMDYVSKVINDNCVTYIIFVPILTRILCDYLETKKDNIAKTVRCFCSIGEAMIPKTVAKLASYLHPMCKIYNLYGPAETTLVSTYHLVQLQDLCEITIPIGRPLPNYQCLILDNYLQPALTGELYIGGIGVFHGYLGHPNLTQQALVNISGEGKWYKTGDLVKLDSNGEIQFVGRLDFQIKLRGQRIETGEIEQIILKDGSLSFEISNCTITKVNDEKTKEDHLIAYIQSTSTEDKQVLESHLKAHCHSWLPSYMIPSMFIILDEFPLNSNGKVARQQLPKPDFRRLQAKIETIEPITRLETVVHSIWCKIFNLNNISMTKNLLELGGDSITKSLNVSQLLNASSLVDHVKLILELEEDDDQDSNTVKQRWKTLNVCEGNTVIPFTSRI